MKENRMMHIVYRCAWCGEEVDIIPQKLSCIPFCCRIHLRKWLENATTEDIRVLLNNKAIQYLYI